jgi:AGZA family xanthine/uracil permease-like MFS transporter
MYKLFTLTSQPINYSRELIGGVTNFMAIAYIIIVNPIIMHASGKAFAIAPTITATILTIIIMTTLAGFIIKLPFVIAPGMGINAMVSYTLVLNDKLPLNTTLGVVFWSSLILFIFSVTRLRQKVINAIPESLQLALSVGIGLFLILVGLKNANLIISNSSTLLSMNKIDESIILCFIGFILATVLLIRQKIYALILPIILVTVIHIVIGKNQIPKQILAWPDFSLFLQVDLLGCLKLSLLPAILSLFIVNFFDATSSVVGLLSQVNYQDNKLKDRYYKRALAADGLGGIVSGLVGTAPGVIFVESSAAIHNGAKTGLASLITAVLCVPFLFLSPLISLIPNAATAPVLILVGILMMHNLRKIKFSQLEDFIAVILTVIMMPLCFSITAGAVFGIVSYTLLKLVLGKFDQISPSLIIVAICCLGWFTIN